MSLQHLTDDEIIEAANDPHAKLNALVVDILTGKHGHADLVALVFRMGETIKALDTHAKAEMRAHADTKRRLDDCAAGKCACMYAGR